VVDQGSQVVLHSVWRQPLHNRLCHMTHCCVVLCHTMPTCTWPRMQLGSARTDEGC
jgi:hypothetical protein